jgi:triosephosphate isomerase
VNTKTRAALAANLHAIVCVGETLEQREGGEMESVIETQVRGSLAGLSENEWQNIIVAYEPVWAIGTGKTASPEQAQEVHAFIRGVIANMQSSSVADATRLQYGGSVKAANARELFSQQDIDGGLIGGAALDPAGFAEIIKAAM